MSNSNRPTWANTWFQIAEVLSRRATCPRLHTGAVIVSHDLRILSTGYNGSPEDSPHCQDVGCLMIEGHCTRAVHAELNALLYAARKGISIETASMYILHAPCVRCAICIAQAGIWEVHYLHDYGDLSGVERLDSLSVNVTKHVPRSQG